MAYEEIMDCLLHMPFYFQGDLLNITDYLLWYKLLPKYR